MITKPGRRWTCVQQKATVKGKTSLITVHFSSLLTCCLLISHPVGFHPHVNLIQTFQLFSKNVDRLCWLTLTSFVQMKSSVSSGRCCLFNYFVCFLFFSFLTISCCFYRGGDLDQSAHIYHLRPNLCLPARKHVRCLCVCVFADVWEKLPLATGWWIFATADETFSCLLLVYLTKQWLFSCPDIFCCCRSLSHVVLTLLLGSFTLCDDQWKAEQIKFIKSCKNVYTRFSNEIRQSSSLNKFILNTVISHSLMYRSIQALLDVDSVGLNVSSSWLKLGAPSCLSLSELFLLTFPNL